MAKSFKLIRLINKATGYFYTTKKPLKSMKQYKVTKKKFDPRSGKHEEFVEDKIK